MRNCTKLVIRIGVINCEIINFYDPGHVIDAMASMQLFRIDGYIIYVLVEFDFNNNVWVWSSWILKKVGSGRGYERRFKIWLFFVYLNILVLALGDCPNGFSYFLGGESPAFICRNNVPLGSTRARLVNWSGVGDALSRVVNVTKLTRARLVNEHFYEARLGSATTCNQWNKYAPIKIRINFRITCELEVSCMEILKEIICKSRNNADLVRYRSIITQSCGIPMNDQYVV
ncbi:hypothetical protein LXL04_002902 [Taraxacum kok-saghyz]